MLNRLDFNFAIMLEKSKSMSRTPPAGRRGQSPVTKPTAEDPEGQALARPEGSHAGKPPRAGEGPRWLRGAAWTATAGHTHAAWGPGLEALVPRARGEPGSASLRSPPSQQRCQLKNVAIGGSRQAPVLGAPLLL